MNGSNQSRMISRRDAAHRFAMAAALAPAAVVMSSLGGVTAVLLSVSRADAAHPKKGVTDMTQDLAKLAAEHFEPLVGETFTIGEYQLTLRDVRRMKFRSRFREQFSITFKAPRDLPIRSERMTVMHPAIGRHDLLVTQILDDAEGTALEICFS